MAAWRRAAGALLAGGAAVAAALAMPVRPPDPMGVADPGDILPAAVSEPEPENLGAFLESRRWGGFVEEKAREAPPPPDEPSLNPVLASMGFVGLIVTGDESAVLLESPAGGITRVAPGETLPDGRILVSVTDNQLVLKGEDMPEEVLTLFPPVPGAPRDGGLPAEADGSVPGTILADEAGGSQ